MCQLTTHSFQDYSFLIDVGGQGIFEAGGYNAKGNTSFTWM